MCDVAVGATRAVLSLTFEIFITRASMFGVQGETPTFVAVHDRIYILIRPCQKCLIYDLYCFVGNFFIYVEKLKNNLKNSRIIFLKQFF